MCGWTPPSKLLYKIDIDSVADTGGLSAIDVCNRRYLGRILRSLPARELSLVDPTLPAECTFEPPRHRVGGHDALLPHIDSQVSTGWPIWQQFGNRIGNISPMRL